MRRTFSGFDVAVDDATVVRVLERRADLPDDTDGARRLDPLFLADRIDEVHAVELLGHEVVGAVRLAAEVEDAEDVRVVHPARGERLRSEARDGLLAIACVVVAVLAVGQVDDLDGAGAPEIDVLGGEDAAHRAGADDAAHAVAAGEHAPLEVAPAGGWCAR